MAKEIFLNFRWGVYTILGVSAGVYIGTLLWKAIFSLLFGLLILISITVLGKWVRILIGAQQ